MLFDMEGPERMRKRRVGVKGGGEGRPDDAGTDEAAILVAVEGKRLNVDNVLNSCIISYTGERI